MFKIGIITILLSYLQNQTVHFRKKCKIDCTSCLLNWVHWKFDTHRLQLDFMHSVVGCFFLIQSIHVKKMLNQQCGNSGLASVWIYTKYMPLDQNILKYY